MKPMLFAACLFSLLPFAATAQTAATPAGECGEGGRCVASAQLKTETGELFGTIGIQVGKDGSDPIAFALVPLGVAVRPGVRIVTGGGGELSLGVDACFPDGCRATLELSPEQLRQLADAPQMSLQFFPLQADKALSGDVTGAGLGDALRKAGATLP